MWHNMFGKHCYKRLLLLSIFPLIFTHAEKHCPFPGFKIKSYHKVSLAKGMIHLIDGDLVIHV